MNIIEIFGHLGADVETRSTPDGTKVSTLRMATNIKKGDKEITTWYQVSLWGNQWDRLLPYLTKGKGLIVIGELQPPRIYMDRNNVNQVALDVRGELIRFSPFGRTDKPEGQQQQGTTQYGQTQYGQGQQAAPRAPQQQPAAAFGGEFPEGHVDQDVPF